MLRRTLTFTLRSTAFLATAFLAVACFVLLGHILCLSAPILAAEPDDTLSIILSRTAVRKEPKHWAPAVTTLIYGSQVKLISPGTGWLKVKTSEGLEGFLHESAVTHKKILSAAPASFSPVSAEDSDIVLAGKGFNNEVEEFYKNSVGEDFSAVDKLLALQVPDAQLAQFIKSGKLNQTPKN